MIRPFGRPLKERAGFRVLTGQHLPLGGDEDERDQPASSASATCPTRTHPNRFEGRVVVFDGPEDYHHRIDDPALAIDENTMLFMRGAGPKGYPGAAEVVNMRAPDYLLKQGITSLVCVGDGRQSGTSGSPSILNASPEAASGGGLALIETGDRVVARPERRDGWTCWWTTTSSPGGAQRLDGRRRLSLSGAPDALAGDPARASSASSRPARCWSRRSSTSASPRPRASRATITDPAAGGCPASASPPAPADQS